MAVLRYSDARATNLVSRPYDQGVPPAVPSRHVRAPNVSVNFRRRLRPRSAPQKEQCEAFYGDRHHRSFTHRLAPSSTMNFVRRRSTRLFALDQMEPASLIATTATVGSGSMMVEDLALLEGQCGRLVWDILGGAPREHGRSDEGCSGRCALRAADSPSIACGWSTTGAAGLSAPRAPAKRPGATRHSGPGRALEAF